jgi:phosphatidyl-myo-inositol dimannoside synthase
MSVSLLENKSRRHTASQTSTGRSGVMAKPEPMLVGTVLLAAGQGGIARVARMTARAMIERGGKVELLSLLDQQPVEVAGVQAQHVHGSRALYVLACQLAALRTSRAIFDCVGTARAYPRFRRQGYAYATWIHGIEVWYDLHADRKRALAGSAVVLVNSQFTLEKYQSLHGPLPRAKLCWLATEEDDPPAFVADFSGPPKVLCVGRIDLDQNYKGHRELIEAWPTVAAAVPDARLVFAGGGSGLTLLQSVAAASPAARSIDVLGFVPESDVAALWQTAHVFAMPSRKEGFGIVYAEAMRHGLPIIASVHDAGQEVNIDGVTGYNVDLDQPGQLAERLIHVLVNTGHARKLGAAGFKRWQEHFRYSAFAARLNDCLNGFL